MTREEEWANYLSGEVGDAKLEPGERAALDRIDEHLGAGGVWEAPAADGQFRLLAAASAEAAARSVEPTPVQEVGAAAEPVVAAIPSSTPVAKPGPDDPQAGPRSVDAGRSSSSSLDPADIEDDDGVIRLLDRRRARRQRATWFGAGALAVAAVAAIAAISSGQLSLNSGDLDSDTDSDIGPQSQEVALFTHELTATELDPDTVATLDVLPTAAGVEFTLHLMSLDNTEGPDYYAAWLLSENDAAPLGSFHWRAGGVPIVLWSGVDDPAYNRFVVTRQTLGDSGIRSSEVVLSGSVPILTAEG